MTITDLPTARTRVRAVRDSRPESAAVTRLRAMLKDEAQRAHWPEIRQAIDYLTATSVLAA